jgi:hypothetical protein
MEELLNIKLENNLTLEPRYQEYLKKITYFKKNNIHFDSKNVEREFGITHDDKLKLRAFLKGKKDIYGVKTQDKYTQQFKKPTFEIQHEDFKKDPRYERLQKKIQRDKDAMASRNNYFGEHQSELLLSSHMTRNLNNNLNNNSNNNLNNQDTLFLDSKPYLSDYKLNVKHESPRTYNNPATVRQRLYYNESFDDLPKNDFRSIQEKLNSYTQQLGGTRDIMLEQNAKFKSLGYKNVPENSFNYISSDIQNPDHNVMAFPEASRLENNYRRAKPYKRIIY